MATDGTSCDADGSRVRVGGECSRARFFRGRACTAPKRAPESKRLGRAKDYIADEQWPRAIEELRVAVADSKEPRRDEALYWLAHSLNQSGDQASAVETIGRLERDFPSSMWVKPARSLRIEIAVRLHRSDVLWWTALPQPAVERPRRRRPRARPGDRHRHHSRSRHRRRRIPGIQPRSPTTLMPI